MKSSEVLQAWSGILAGRRPSLSIEITKECPLRCPGCYAFDLAHLGGGTDLRQLSDFKGAELVQRVLAVVDREKPLHLSIVGGDPLVRHRELEILQLIGQGHGVQQIAQELNLSAKTVETHRAHIKEKLNFQSARELARFAVQWVDQQVV